MTDAKLKGTKIRLVRPVSANTGHIEQHSEGRIRYVTENLGRSLYLIDWDRGGSTMLFSDEIEIVDSAA